MSIPLHIWFFIKLCPLSSVLSRSSYILKLSDSLGTDE